MLAGGEEGAEPRGRLVDLAKELMKEKLVRCQDRRPCMALMSLVEELLGARAASS